jgi:TRAP-type C4-dicarboxylate transport system permease small subunit
VCCLPTGVEVKQPEGTKKMGRLDALKKTIQKMNRWVAGVGACFLIPLMLITAADVVGRDVFNHPIPGVIELSQYLLAVSILLGLAYTQQIKGHVGVSILISRLSMRAQLLVSLFGSLLGLFLFVLLAWQGLIVGLEEKTVSDMLRVPQYPFRLLVAVAAFLTFLELLIDLGSSIQKLGRTES